MDMGGLHAAQTEVFDLATLQLRTNAYYYIVRLSPQHGMLRLMTPPFLGSMSHISSKHSRRI